MKKLFLLGALVCAGQLYGMEPIKEEAKAQKEALAIYTSPEMFPELQREIIKSALAASKDYEEAVQMIKKLSIMHGMQFDKLFNLKDFTKLAHILADQFDVSTTMVASEFNTPIAKKYNELGHSLLDYAGDSREEAHNKIIDFIKQGADVNFSAHRTPLDLVIDSHDLKGVQLLLAAGAKPTDWDLRDAKQEAHHLPENKEAVMIVNLIEDAMKNNNK